MQRGSIEQILAELIAAEVEFVVVGGVAVVLHGYPRLTVDLDLVVRLERDNVLRAVGALQRLDFHPRVPVSALEFAEPERRKEWIEQKGMRVFSFWSDRFRDTPIDLFVEEPVPFPELSENAVRISLGDLEVRVASVPHLVRMKRAAGRVQDLEDIRALEELDHRPERGDRG